MSEIKDGEILDKEVLEEINFQKTLTPKENALRVMGLQEKLKKMNIDSLTGLKNRDLIEDQMRVIENLLKRSSGRYCVLFCDVDDLKRINDTEGHSRGNEVILAVSDLLKKSVKRESDLIGRWTKGDEFIVVLTEAGDDGAYTFYKRLSENYKDSDRLNNVSLSIGASTCDFSRGGVGFQDTVDKADFAMYRSKENKKVRTSRIGMILYNELGNEQK
jgi:diguanylate cyclase (GGDEF)-like protein